MFEPAAAAQQPPPDPADAAADSSDLDSDYEPNLVLVGTDREGFTLFLRERHDIDIDDLLDDEQLQQLVLADDGIEYAGDEYAVDNGWRWNPHIRRWIHRDNLPDGIRGQDWEDYFEGDHLILSAFNDVFAEQQQQPDPAAVAADAEAHILERARREAQQEYVPGRRPSRTQSVLGLSALVPWSRSRRRCVTFAQRAGVQCCFRRTKQRSRSRSPTC